MRPQAKPRTFPQTGGDLGSQVTTSSASTTPEAPSLNTRVWLFTHLLKRCKYRSQIEPWHVEKLAYTAELIQSSARGGSGPQNMILSPTRGCSNFGFVNS